MTPLVSVIIVTWNSAEFIRFALDSIKAQVMPLEIIVVDNDSKDLTPEIVKSYNNVIFIETGKNLGYCAANNLGIQSTNSDFILLLNPDAMITENFICRALVEFEKHPRAAILTGKILRMSSEGKPLLMDGKPVIDSTGIKILRNRQAVDRGQGEIDKGQYNCSGPVDAACGSILFARTKALLEAAVDGEIFDQNFFAYKEDVDLCWRLRRLGWEIFYAADLTAYHARNWKPGFHARKTISSATRYHSFKNRRLMMLKNETFASFFHDIHYIIAFEIISFFFILFFEQFLLRAYFELLRLFPNVLHWRKELNNRHPKNNVFGSGKGFY
jgi:GT2 family glycosyltransferase